MLKFVSVRLRSRLRDDPRGDVGILAQELSIGDMTPRSRSRPLLLETERTTDEAETAGLPSAWYNADEATVKRGVRGVGGRPPVEIDAGTRVATAREPGSGSGPGRSMTIRLGARHGFCCGERRVAEWGAIGPLKAKHGFESRWGHHRR